MPLAATSLAFCSSIDDTAFCARLTIAERFDRATIPVLLCLELLRIPNGVVRDGRRTLLKIAKDVHSRKWNHG
jgi:hypothetical protein